MDTAAVIASLPQKASVAIATNESFSGWTKTFTHPRLCAAIVDRLTFNGSIIETGTDSYRLAQQTPSSRWVPPKMQLTQKVVPKQIAILTKSWRDGIEVVAMDGFTGIGVYMDTDFVESAQH